MASNRRCRMCDAELVGRTPRAKYCSESCRKEFQRKFAAQAKENQVQRKEDFAKGGAATGIPDYVQKARELVQKEFDQAGKLDDEVRELMREEIRAGIRGRVIENVEKAAELMTGMLPMAMARIAQDLDSESWPERSRAYALIMRYAMPLIDAKAKPGDSDQTVTIVHHIPVPEGPMGERFTEEYLDDGSPGVRVHVDEPYDPQNPEPWEADWPVCDSCKNRVHPDNARGSKGEGRPLCTACEYKHSALRSAKRPDNLADTEVFNDDRPFTTSTRLIEPGADG